jgi:uncharacterized protein YgbK (DUF1537 family)
MSLLLCFYGDDFTGSTDVMEALARSGVPTALFIEPPTPAQLEALPDVQAIGVAGVSRSLTPPRMEAELRPVFAALKVLGAPLVHYKICSTFDSSPQVGSIGHAIEVAQSSIGSPWVPLVVGAPILGRYCVFGNLFARSGAESEPFRLDRHPTMKQHPTTPMTESDLPLHLAQQTARNIGLFDVLKLAQAPEDAQSTLATLRNDAEIVLFDTLTNEHLPTIGRLIWNSIEEHQTLFCVGSSGVEYALTAHWREAGMLPQPPVFKAPAVEQLVAVSGSCSPVTARQIEWALENGWQEIALQPAQFIGETQRNRAIDEAVERAIKGLSTGANVLLHTCRGPQDPRLEATAQALQNRGAGAGTAELLGCALGTILRRIIEATQLPRAAVTGGDTSGYVARALGIESLDIVTPLAPGSPLCRARSQNAAIDGLEIIFKGGQVGRVDFFDSVRRGRP